MSVRKKIEEIMSSNKGKVFILKDFDHLGCKNTIKSAMLRLCNSGKVKRLLRGVYVMKKYSEVLGVEISPTMTKVAEKYVERFGGKTMEIGVAATNKAGACTQVAARIYLGVNRRINRTITTTEGAWAKLFTVPNRYVVKSDKGNLLIQSLRDFGRKNKRYFKRLNWFVQENKSVLEQEDFSKLPYKWLRKAIKDLLLKN